MTTWTAWDLAVVLARQKPAWEPGTRQAYHAITPGFHESDLLRRIDPQDRSLGRFFQDEIASPLGSPNPQLPTPNAQLPTPKRYRPQDMPPWKLGVGSWELGNRVSFISLLEPSGTVR